jgi:hypothetical protein
MPVLAGRPLRYFLTLALVDSPTRLSVPDLVAALEAAGITTVVRPSKAVSDALRWEVRRGRVDRLDRSRYRARPIPESTLRYMRRLLATWIDQADPIEPVGTRPRAADDPRSAPSVTVPVRAYGPWAARPSTGDKGFAAS